MFRPNDEHRQTQMFTTLDSLPSQERALLEQSWAATFYREVFCRLDERPFAVLYAEEPSRPNIPVNVLLALELLKAGAGWSDEELISNFYFNVQVRYALGLLTLGDGHFDLRTMYNFRHRLSQHLQATGENLIAQGFEQVTDEQLADWAIKTGRVRMDSTQVASNIRTWSRLHLLVEVVQRVHRSLRELDQVRYAADFAPYVQGSSSQYVYRVRSEEGLAHLQRVGELMAHLITTLAATYETERPYQLLVRVFHEHFTVTDRGWRLKVGAELSSANLHSPDDEEATFRRKRTHAQVGYVANVSETCDPANPCQLIVKVQVAPNVTDDPVLMAQALPELKERLDLTELHTDGGYNNEATATLARALGVDHQQTALRGHVAAGLGLAAFDFGDAAPDQVTTVTCPHGQQVPAVRRRRAQRFARAYFSADQCAPCPLRDQCPTKTHKRTSDRTLSFDPHDVEIARRRRRLAENRHRNLRAAVESTIAAIKHPFRQGKLPVRGRFRVACMTIASAAMVNLRRIHRYLVHRPLKNAEQGVIAAQLRPLQPSFSSLLQLLGRSNRLLLGHFVRPSPVT